MQRPCKNFTSDVPLLVTETAACLLAAVTLRTNALILYTDKRDYYPNCLCSLNSFPASVFFKLRADDSIFDHFHKHLLAPIIFCCMNDANDA